MVSLREHEHPGRKCCMSGGRDTGLRFAEDIYKAPQSFSKRTSMACMPLPDVACISTALSLSMLMSLSSSSPASSSSSPAVAWCS